ncbi:MAG: hypothetical protein ACREP1_14275, partial [Rhodanobacteraceae bacterium]
MEGALSSAHLLRAGRIFSSAEESGRYNLLAEPEIISGSCSKGSVRWLRSDVEAELDDVAIFHDVFLA